MLTRPLLETVFEAASIQRWNDHIRPHKGFTELDKQAHKFIYAYVLAKFEEETKKVDIDWVRLIEGGIFELLHRIVLTDIKPPIFHKLMEQKGQELNTWVITQLGDKLRHVKGDFLTKFETYLQNPDYSYLEKRILKAAHYLATNWEFSIIYNLNSSLYGVEETKAKLESEMEDHLDLSGVQKIQMGKKTSNFLDLVGQLRFQQRWSQTPRIPETSVLGHMLIVAILSYLCSRELDASNKRIYNNFFAGLFHDLPEVLTRDIVSPVKRSVEGLEQIIKEIEHRQVEEKIFPLLPTSWRQEIKYFTEEEFRSKIVKGGVVTTVTTEDIDQHYNDDQYLPLDGEILKACDHLAAYIEAFLSITHGIKSRTLLEGHKSIHELYTNKTIGGLNFGQVCELFIIDHNL